ncbi:hypothetical protein BC829DRAFT_211435 [Chytridium lagenaria]|nr:hypothetical protein BC829DRAFT_211435 [Chytridium lagenaria]
MDTLVRAQNLYEEEKKRLEDSKSEIEGRLSAVIQDKEQTIESLRQQIETQVLGLHSEVQKSKDLLKQTVEEAAAEKEALQAKLDAQIAEIADRVSSITTLKTEIEQLRSHQYLESDLTSTRQLLIVRESDLATAVANHGSALAARDEELHFAQDALSSARQKILALEEEIHVKSEALLGVKEELDVAINTPAQAVVDPAIAEREGALHNEVTQLKQDLDELKALREAEKTKSVGRLMR